MNQLERGKPGVASPSKVSRIKVLAILGIVGLGAMVARSKACSPVNEQAALVQPRVSEQPDEVVMGRQIEAIERNFSQLEAQLRADIAMMPAGSVRVPPNLIWQPFRLVADNRANPYRNLPALLAHPTAPIEQVASIGWFQYNFLRPATDAGLQLGATLSVDGMRLQIPRDLDVTRRRDQLVLHHELVHKWQVMNLFEQQQISDADQFSAYRARVEGALTSMGVANVRAISEIDKEVEAYASDIEILNILMHDRLRARRGDVTPEEISAVIGAFHQHRSGSQPTLTFGDLARAYYHEEPAEGNISAHFAQYITRLYRDGLGLTPYIVRGQQVILVDDNMRVQDVRQF